MITDVAYNYGVTDASDQIANMCSEPRAAFEKRKVGIPMIVVLLADQMFGSSSASEYILLCVASHGVPTRTRHHMSEAARDRIADTSIHDEARQETRRTTGYSVHPDLRPRAGAHITHITARAHCISRDGLPRPIFPACAIFADATPVLKTRTREPQRDRQAWFRAALR